jgi:hypothetical protein
MARTAARQQRTPFPTTQNAELKQPAIAKDDHTTSIQQQAAFPTVQNVKLKQRTITEDDLRLRAYEIYLRGDNPGDEVSDWLQAERELLAD